MVCCCGATDAMREENQSLLVVHTGTATTVDSILKKDDGTYDFLGGRIAPGPSLMKDCLTRGIPSLPDSAGQYKVFPGGTSEAIITGIVDAQVGLIVRAQHTMIQKGIQPKVILAGGAAKFIAPYLKEEISDLVVKHNLVLHGLAALALAEEQ